MKSLAIYLVLLVPANYIVFRLIGRVEYAWLAVPVLAIGGAWWIARSVSLDLGLSQYRSEVSLLELQPGHTRGHLTRFGSIYNSLSGDYQLQFGSPDVAMEPVDPLARSQNSTTPVGFRYGFADGLIIDQFTVPSNRTRLFHVEQVVDVGGLIPCDEKTIRNQTKMRFADCVVMRKMVGGEVEFVPLSSFDPGSKVSLNWNATMPRGDAYRSIIPLLNTDAMPVGSIRLVGSIEGGSDENVLDAMTVLPETPIERATRFVVANLRYPPVTRSGGDQNLLPTRKQRQQLSLDPENMPIEVIQEDATP